MRTKRTKTILVSSLSALSLAGLAIADDTTSGYSGLESMEAPKVEQKLQLNPGFTYNAEADFDDVDGDVSVWRLDVPLRYTLETQGGELGLGAFYEYSEYEFSSDFFNADKDVDFTVIAFDALWKSMINDNWGYFVYGGATFAAEKTDNLDDGLTGIGGAGVRYVWSPNLSLGVGAAVASRLEDDALVLPIIALNWQISDRWHLRTLNGATLTYDITGDKTWLADVGVRYQRREYRVGDDGSLTESMLSGELGVTYRFSPAFAMRGFVGMTGGRELEARANDDKIGDEDIDSSPFFGVRAMFTF